MPRLLALLLALVATAAAAETDPERADRLKREAQTLRERAEETYRNAEPACYQRFQVNRCIAQAKEARLERIHAARELENEANRIELAERRRAAAERGRSRTDAPQGPSAPRADDTFAIPTDPAAEQLRHERDAEAARHEADARRERAQKDAVKAGEREEAAAEAAKRAEQAARDRARYEERIRKREAEKAEEAKKAGAK